MHLFWGAWYYSDISHAFRWQLSANIKLRIKMACLLGNDSTSLSLLSLRCANANRFMNFRQ